jgi:hypothetical protein
VVDARCDASNGDRGQYPSDLQQFSHGHAPGPENRTPASYHACLRAAMRLPHFPVPHPARELFCALCFRLGFRVAFREWIRTGRR